LPKKARESLLGNALGSSLLETPYVIPKILLQKGTYLFLTLASIPSALVKILILF